MYKEGNLSTIKYLPDDNQKIVIVEKLLISG